MRRLSNEDGINAGIRNIGRYALFMIPAALGGAACLWIAAGLGWIDLSREIRKERRLLDGVHISVPADEPIKQVAFDDRCLKVDKMFLDSEHVTFYVRNSCDRYLPSP